MFKIIEYKIYGEDGLGVDRFSHTKRIKTGIKDLDDIISGFLPGQLISLGARPGLGKSAMALQIAYNVTKKKPGSKAKEIT